MSKKENYIDQIEYYLDGELSDNELMAFEAELQKNTVLQEELAYYKMANAAIIDNKLHDVSALVKQVGQEHHKKVGRKKQIKKTLVISGVALLLGIATVSYWSKDADKPVPVEENTMPQLPQSNDIKKVNIQDNVEEKHQKVQIDTTAEAKQKPGLENEDDLAVEEGGLSQASEIKVDTSGEFEPEVETTPALQVNQTSPVGCDEVTIKAKIVTSPTCSGRAEGVITVTQVSGGKSPYSFVLSTGQENGEGIFESMTAGTYSLYVSDQQACGALFDGLVIQSNSCKVNLYFDPVSAQPVVFPEYEKAGVLSIFDKKGQLKQKVTIQAGELYQWSNDESLVAGYYLFKIEYVDGNVQNGSLTIMP